MKALQLRFFRVALVLPRCVICALLIGFTVLATGESADAGIVTSLEVGAYAAVESEPLPADQVRGAHFSLVLRMLLLLERSSGCDHGFPAPSSTTGGPTGTSIGPIQPHAAFPTVADAEDSAEQGWVFLEVTLALPPLLPSGLFRPPKSC
jgi:hypothetical protein